MHDKNRDIFIMIMMMLTIQKKTQSLKSHFIFINLMNMIRHTPTRAHAHVVAQ